MCESLVDIDLTLKRCKREKNKGSQEEFHIESIRKKHFF